MRTENIILDTNTLISAFLLKRSTSRDVYEKAKNNYFLVASQQTFNELKQVLFRPKFDKYLSVQIRNQILKDFFQLLSFYEPTSEIQICRDPKDNKFLELALISNAKLLISGDKDLLELNHNFSFKIIKPVEFLELK